LIHLAAVARPRDRWCRRGGAAARSLATGKRRAGSGLTGACSGRRDSLRAVRLVSYDSQAGPRAGVIRDEIVVDAWDALGGGGEGMRELLASGRLGELTEAPVEGQALSEVELLAPVPDPEKIIGIGLNYRDHAAEAGLDPPESPTFFAKFRNALAADGATVALPAASRKVDYEAEVAFVVGRRAKNVAEADALEHIVGYTLLNDLSARDLQFATPQWMPGKVFDGAAPCGPAIVTPDEAGPHDAIAIALDLNGERMQESTTAELVFSIPQLLARLSALMTLEPGDLVSTGTPAGIGGARQPRVWLAPGDEVVVSSPQLGRLRTRLA
jgi:2-keto-4-pentenoate hydratase/2-oxohepta-3-ene-1,7-dioic acid hydratase in catechol pathway